MTRRAWLLFAVMSVLWGVPYLLIKVAIAELSPFAVVWLRCAVGAAVLLPLAVRRGVLRQLRGRWGMVVALALVEVTVPWLLIASGEQLIASSLTGLLIASEPLFIALLALRFDPSERVGGTRMVGLLVGIAGVLALLGLDVAGETWELIGAGMVLVATFCYAIAALIVKRAFADVSPVAVSTATVALNAALLAPLGLVTLPDHPPSAAAAASLAALGLFCTALALIAFFSLIAAAGAGRATVFTYVNPAVAVALGVALLGEPVTAGTVAGFLLVIAGSWLSTGDRLPPGAYAWLSRKGLTGAGRGQVEGRRRAHGALREPGRGTVAPGPPCPSPRPSPPKGRRAP